ncbi:MAG: hypothetical protein H0W66_07830 [Chthoniobacterales bacterium]|nr:hypothetical protein [Chthoniobacterales bacterium]
MKCAIPKLAARPNSEKSPSAKSTNVPTYVIIGITDGRTAAFGGQDFSFLPAKKVSEITTDEEIIPAPAEF